MSGGVPAFIVAVLVEDKIGLYCQAVSGISRSFIHGNNKLKSKGIVILVISNRLEVLKMILKCNETLFRTLGRYGGI